jgi:hypothetical protein
MEYLKNVLIGSDVEFFAGASNGKIASAEGFIPGTKKEPFRFNPKIPGFATQLDNILAEGNIPPCKSVYEFATNMEILRAHIDQVLGKHKLHSIAQADADVPEKYLQTENAKEFGCDTSYNCWTLEPEPVTPTQPTLRTAGFHIHIGYDNPSKELNIALARALDISLGLSTVGYEPASKRRELGYGRAGNFRHQPHGVEYRVLSSWWARDSSHISWVAIHALETTRRFNMGTVIPMIRGISLLGNDVQGAINTNDTKLARDVAKTAQQTGAYMPIYNPRSGRMYDASYS